MLETRGASRRSERARAVNVARRAAALVAIFAISPRVAIGLATEIAAWPTLNVTASYASVERRATVVATPVLSAYRPPDRALELACALGAKVDVFARAKTTSS